MTHDEKIVEAVATAEVRYDGYEDLLCLSRTMRERYLDRARAAITAYQAEVWQPSADAIDALASSWASIDGKLGLYDRERGLTLKQAMQANLPGHYAGYQEEAAEMIRRLKARGFDVVPLPPAPKATP